MKRLILFLSLDRDLSADDLFGYFVAAFNDVKSVARCLYLYALKIVIYGFYKTMKYRNLRHIVLSIN